MSAHPPIMLRLGTVVSVDATARVAWVRFPGGADPHPVRCVEGVPTAGAKVAVWATPDRLYYTGGGGGGTVGPQGPPGTATPMYGLDLAAGTANSAQATMPGGAATKWPIFLSTQEAGAGFTVANNEVTLPADGHYAISFYGLIKDANAPGATSTVEVFVRRPTGMAYLFGYAAATLTGAAPWGFMVSHPPARFTAGEKLAFYYTAATAFNAVNCRAWITRLG